MLDKKKKHSSGNDNKTVNILNIRKKIQDILQQQALRHFNMYPRIDFTSTDMNICVRFSSTVTCDEDKATSKCEFTLNDKNTLCSALSHQYIRFCRRVTV